MPDYLLLESGGRIILEDGSGFLLLEAQPEPQQEQQATGGYPERRRKREFDWFARLPSEVEKQLERERLGIVPKRSQKTSRQVAQQVAPVPVTIPQVITYQLLKSIVADVAASMPPDMRLRDQIEYESRQRLQAIQDAIDEDEAIAFLLLHS